MPVIMTRVLLTTTSFQDTPGPHHARLEQAGIEVHRQRGPLDEEAMLELAGAFDAFLCGDDAITRAVLEKSMPRLRVISKYGIGVDKIDVPAATELGVPVTFCPGVNHTTVAEHAFLLMLMLARRMREQLPLVPQWKRLTGHELMGKRLGIIGLGRIGKEVAVRARAFGMEVLAYDINRDTAFANKQQLCLVDTISELLRESDILSLHTSLTPETRGLVNEQTLRAMKPGAFIINCARGELVDTPAIAAALRAKTLGGYATDVLAAEPPPPEHPLLGLDNCLVTPHIGSRTCESVQRQAGMAVDNLLLALDGKKPLAQVNEVGT